MLKTGKSPSPTNGTAPFTQRRQVTARGLLIILACAAWSLGIQAPALSGQQRPGIDQWTADHFRLARQAQARNNLEVAAEEYRAIVARNPGFAGALLNLGIVYHQQRKYREAIRVLEKAVSLEPRMLGAQLFLGIDQYLVQDLNGAVQHLGNALELKPDDRQAGLYLALAQLALDQPEKAAQQLRKTARYFPEDPEVFYNQGEAYLSGVALSLRSLRKTGGDSALYHWALAMAAEQKNDLVTCVEEYLKALIRDPGIAGLYLRLAIEFTKIGMTDLANSALEKYKLLNPARELTDLNLTQKASTTAASGDGAAEHKETFVRLWRAIPPAKPIPGLPAVADNAVNRLLKARLASPKSADLKEAVRLYLKGDYPNALARVRPRVDRHADAWLSAYLLARCYLATSDDDAAQAVLENHLARYFDQPSVALLRVEVESRLALKCFHWVASRQPDSYLAKLLLARSYAAAEQNEQAIAVYQEVLKAVPGRLGVHLAIGQIHERQMHWEPAIEEYRAELALDPDNAMALAHLGHAYTQVRDPDHAIPTLDRLLESNPTDGQAYADLGKAWALKGDAPKAIAAYENALRYDPTANDVHYRLFQLYSKLGQSPIAQKHLAAFKEGEARQKEAYRETMVGHEQESAQGAN